jgi:predicted DNA-binding WGR domain protein
VAGDHPSVRRGPAVSIAWDHHEEASLNLHEYEASRPPRRTKLEFQMPASTRRDLLEKSGVSREDISRSLRESNRVKRNRSTSSIMQEFEGLQIVRESLVRKWKRWRKGQSSAEEFQEEQDQLWKNANTNAEKKVPPAPESSPTATPASSSTSLITTNEEEEMTV